MIETISMTNVMGFEEFSVPYFPPITVILGKNDVCKTALLKMMYAVGKSTELYGKQASQDESVQYRPILSEKIQNVYGVKKALGELVRKNGTPKKLSVAVRMADTHIKEVAFTYGTDTKSMITDYKMILNPESKKQINYIFIPAKEVLTAFNTIRAISRQYFFPGWDDTTLDLIDLLDIPVQEKRDEFFTEILQKIREMFSGELKQISSNERFVYKKNNTEYALPLTAEGVKHIGILSTLIENGQIKEGTVLFLDEPEDNLHPSALRQLVKIIGLFAQKGVQVFLTTHNYFTLKQLQIEARTLQMDILCCGLKRNDKGTIDADFSNLRDGMPDNEIVAESMAMLDEDIETSFRGERN